MPAAGILLLAAALAAVAAFAPLRWGFAALVATVLLVPATLVVPNGFTALPTVGRVVLLAGAAGLAVRIARGEVSRRVLAPTVVHLALGGLLVVALVLGVGAATPLTSLSTSVMTWLDLAEQALFFVVVLAWIRAVGDVRVVTRIAAGVLLAAALVAVAEHVTGRAWGAFLFHGVPSQQGTDAAWPLSVRAGQVRVRAGAQFALEYAWTVVALVPLAALAATRLASRWRWPVTAVVVGVPVLTLWWAFSRSASVGLVIVLAIAAVAARDRRIGAIAGVSAVVALVLVVALPSLVHMLSFAIDPGAIEVRFQRLPAILDLVAAHRWTGLGLGGLDAAGFPTTDSSYLLAYADLGATGAAALVATLLVGLGACARGLRGTAGHLRATAGVAFAGAAALVLGAVTFDTFSVLGAARVFWLLVALGVVAAEQARGPAWIPSFAPRRLAWPVGLAAVGVVIALAAPTHVARAYTFRTLSTKAETVGFDPVNLGQTLINTTCGTAEAVVADRPGTAVACADRHDAAGAGNLRVVAPSEAELDDTVQAIRTTVAQRTAVRSLLLLPLAPAATGRPTLLATAPASLFVLGLLALLWPSTGDERAVTHRVNRPARNAYPGVGTV